MRFVAFLAGLLAVCALATAPAASAHAARIAVDPADGAQLARGPASVSATFNEPLQTAFASMVVVGPDGNTWSSGDPRVQGAVISVDVRPLGPAGRYTVNYRVTSADGHVVNGAWAFQLTAPGTGTPGPAASGAASADGFPIWPFVAIGVAAVAIGAGVALYRGKRG
jgi:copper resistance protein C